jgi:hypothetical protein
VNRPPDAGPSLAWLTQLADQASRRTYHESYVRLALLSLSIRSRFGVPSLIEVSCRF